MFNYHNITKYNKTSSLVVRALIQQHLFVNLHSNNIWTRQLTTIHSSGGRVCGRVTSLQVDNRDGPKYRIFLRKQSPDIELGRCRFLSRCRLSFLVGF